MKLLVIDSKGGRVGQSLIEKIRAAKLPCEITAVGTNAIATAAMVKAGADQAATGENPIVVACRTADVIVGAIGILAADAMMGEITARIALNVGRCPAVKLLLPMNLCNHVVVGTRNASMAKLLDETVDILHDMCEKETAGQAGSTPITP